MSRELDSGAMFTVEQRDAVRERVLSLAKADPRVVAGAVVGSLANGGGDRFTDLDLTFAVTDGVPLADVLTDWTRVLGAELDAVHVIDLDVGTKTYRVLVLPDALQLDLSMCPASEFRTGGSRFVLVFGEGAGIAEPPPAAPVVAADVFGWGVIYALHASACIARGRLWQAEHYAGAVRDAALTLACLRHGLRAVQARGYDDLPPEVLNELAETHVGALTANGRRVALAAVVRALMREGVEAGVPNAEAVAQRVGAALDSGAP